MWYNVGFQQSEVQLVAGTFSPSSSSKQLPFSTRADWYNTAWLWVEFDRSFRWFYCALLWVWLDNTLQKPWGAIIASKDPAVRRSFQTRVVQCPWGILGKCILARCAIEPIRISWFIQNSQLISRHFLLSPQTGGLTFVSVTTYMSLVTTTDDVSLLKHTFTRRPKTRVLVSRDQWRSRWEPYLQFPRHLTH